ncbi:MAG TPA: SCO family protein, partial [Solirubrobacteraceae bacterium]
MDSTQPPEPAPSPPGRGFDPRLLLALVAILIIAGGIALLTQGGNSSSQQLPGNVSTVSSASFRGSEASPPKLAPALALRNYLGQSINIGQYRGKALFITFLYTNCPDVCPLITSNLRVAQSMMSPQQRAKTQIIAVSVDPRGDTPKAVAAFLKR